MLGGDDDKHDKLTVVGCTLHDLVSANDKENDSSLPSDQSVLTEILTTKVLFIHTPSPCTPAGTNALLNEINGTLFAPRQFKEHHDILASNTGIVSTSSLSRRKLSANENYPRPILFALNENDPAALDGFNPS